MSEIKGLEKLRKLPFNGNRLGIALDINLVADEIEREIAERYMKLPVDADGVPIHVGDAMEANGNVLFVAHDKVVFEEGNASPVYRYAKGQRHAKPRTLEDVLGEYYISRGWDEVDNYALKSEDLTAKYADEIRAMFGKEE